MAPSITLFKNGTVLLHEGPDDAIVPTKADVLVKGNTITRIEPDISLPSSAQLIDCTNKIISPGFVDAHQHVWQTQLRGRHADQTFWDYMPSGALQASNYTRSDFFWGQLAGCLSLLDVGTTTVLDHAHMNYFPEASPTAFSAMLTSGIRAIHAYNPTVRVASWNPLTFNPNPLEPWVLSTLSSLGERARSEPQSRVRLGLAFDAWFLPPATIHDLFDRAARLGIRVLTSHWVQGPQYGGAPSVSSTMHAFGLLSPPAPFHVVLSHADGAAPADLELVRAAPAASVASTPGTELQMGLGRSMAFDAALRGRACLGGDCHSNGGTSIVGEMRLGLQAERARRKRPILEAGKAPGRVGVSVAEAFNLGTVGGARALGLEKLVGRVEVGLRADLLVWEGRSPAMVCAAVQDPVAAIVLHSSPADIAVVMVDGVVRKRDGRLLPVTVEEDVRDVAGTEVLEWEDVAREVLESRSRLQERIEGLDLEDAKRNILRTFHVDEGLVADDG